MFPLRKSLLGDTVSSIATGFQIVRDQSDCSELQLFCCCLQRYVFYFEQLNFAFIKCQLAKALGFMIV